LLVPEVCARLQKSYGVPGAQFAAAVDGQIVGVKTFGYADIAARRPVTDDSHFALASGSKPITAMAIFKLIDDGKIALDTTAFPNLGLHAKDERFARITIAQHLNHSSGLKSDVRVVSSDPLDVAKAAVASKLLFTPGQKKAYSNTAFNVLGAVIEQACGQDYRAYIQQNIFAPAGVTDAVALDLAKPIPNQVLQYDKSDNAAGPLPKPLKPRSNGAYYGGGWDVVYHDPSGRLVYGKNGGITGGYSWMEHAANGAVFAELFNGGKSGEDAQWTTAKPIEKALAKR
jgi:CubicO group peptidase (beta-lactamase class C family)